MKRTIIFLALAVAANAGMVRFAAKSTYKVAKFGVNTTKKAVKIAAKVAY